MPMPKSLARALRLPGAALLLAGLAGCASMSTEQCLVADWYQQGMRDAVDGYPRSRLEDNRHACAKAGTAPDEARYFAGHDAGLQQFCTAENGARWGREGHYYRKSCPAALEPAFLPRYEAGRRAYEAEQFVDSLRNEQRSKQEALDKATDDATRKRLREELDQIDARLRTAREDFDHAEQRFRDL